MKNSCSRYTYIDKMSEFMRRTLLLKDLVIRPPPPSAFLYDDKARVASPGVTTQSHSRRDPSVRERGRGNQLSIGI